jgi:peptidoglycan/xylan/chitin deacetylase (PgdA/CDA1 family)
MSFGACEFVEERPDVATSRGARGVPSAPPLHCDLPMDRSLTRRISNRLASYIRREARRLHNRAPMVSFTFDDVPESAHSRGAPMLERRGARGTYYISTALIGGRTPDWTLIDREGVADLHRRGHEIGLHTHKHREVGSFSDRELCADLQRNRTQLQSIDPTIDPRNFAYPFGTAAFERKRALAGEASSSRSVKPGVNAGVFDPHFIKCAELGDRQSTREALRFLLDAVVAQNGWLVFLTHDISNTPSRFGCTPGLFQWALDEVAARGVEVRTVADALRQSAPIGLAKKIAAHFPPR